MGSTHTGHVEMALLSKIVAYQEILSHGIRHVEKSGNWLVIVCPDDLFEVLQAVLIVTLPPETELLGRTAALSNGIFVSLVPASTPIFLPKGTPFSLLLVGWGEVPKVNLGDMSRWKAAAQEIVSKSNHG